MTVTVSLRIDDLLEKRISLAARAQGVTRTQFLINAAELALGERQPYSLMQALKAQQEQAPYEATPEAPYDTDAARAALIDKLKAKHGVGTG